MELTPSSPRFGYRLKAFRIETKMTQSALARRCWEIDPDCRLDAARISDYERGVVMPNVRSFWTLAQALGRSGEELVAGIPIGSLEAA